MYVEILRICVHTHHRFLLSGLPRKGRQRQTRSCGARAVVFSDIFILLADYLIAALLNG
jgi:hypothetical protein